MHHTDRIAETARQHRQLSRRLAKVAIETYLELVAEELAQGQWVELLGIGKLQVTLEGGSGAEGLREHPRLRTKIRLGEALKRRCHRR